MFKVPTKKEKRANPNYVQFWIKIDSNGTDVSELCEQLTQHGIPWLAWDDSVQRVISSPLFATDNASWPQYNYECRWGYMVFDGAREDFLIETWPPEWVIEYE